MNQHTTRLLEEANRVGVSFLYTDLKTAFILLDVADANANEEAGLRNRIQARDGYRTVLRHMPRLRLSPEQRLEIEDKLAAIRSRLKSAGIAADAATSIPDNPGSESER